MDFAHGVTLDSDRNEGAAATQASSTDASAASAGDELPADGSLLAEIFGFLG